MTIPKSAPSTPSDDDWRFTFFDLGLQYYIAGRYAVFAGRIPVCGNLLHHAIEMFLKGALARRLGPAKLKAMGHALPPLWAEFKNEIGDPGLGRFDTVINGLDRFDFIRYPDAMLKNGMRSHIELTVAAWPALPPTASGTEPAYNLVLEEIDELVKVLFEKASVNPLAFTGSLNPDARAYLEREPRARLL